MKTLIASSAALLVAATASADVYTDANFDLFDNGLDNLDISSVSVTDDGTDLTIAVTTRGFQSWTKYLIMMDTAPAFGSTTNAWSRPIFMGNTIERFIGSWVDAGSNNSQLVSWSNGNWDWGNYTTFSNSVSGNTVTRTFTKLGKVTASARYAHYDADTFATDTDKFWLQLDWML